MSVLTRQSNITNYTGFEPYPVEIGISAGATPGLRSGLGWEPIIWNFDLSGGAFKINTSIAIRPYRFYAIYYDFTVNVETPAVNLTDAVMNLSWTDFTGLIAIPILLSIPLNQYTLQNDTVRFTGKYANNVTLYADYLPANPNASPPGLSWDISLVQTPSLGQTAGATNTTMTINGFYVQEVGYDAAALQTGGVESSSKREISIQTPP